MLNRVAGVLIAFVLAPSAFADVAIQSRTSTINGWFTTGQGPPLGDYSDHVTTSDLGTVQLDTPHGQHFTSTATSQTISAAMVGSTQTGGLTNPFSTGYSTQFSVTFDVTLAPVTMSMVITSGSIFPYTGPGAPSGVTLTVVNLTTGQTVYDVFANSPPAFLGGLHDATWTTATWSGLLAPGTYRLFADSHAGATYSAGGGSGAGGGNHFNFTATLTPTPSAAAILGLAPLFAVRRRR